LEAAAPSAAAIASSTAAAAADARRRMLLVATVGLCAIVGLAVTTVLVAHLVTTGACTQYL